MEFDMKELIELARKAGREILNIYEKDFEVEFKDDKSPLTLADKKSHEIIVEGLKKISDFPVLSEEGKKIPYEKRKNWEYYWCVDPLDGTKEFIKKNGEFTVNIALIHNGEPVLGVVYAPVTDIMYYAQKGKGAYKNGEKIEIKKSLKSLKERLNILKNKEELKIVASKSHMNDETKKFINELSQYLTPETLNLVSKGSSLKLCMVADGSADIYPRIAPTMEWDTAAADAIVREAGKMTYIYDEGIWSKVLDNNTQYPKSNTQDQTPNTKYPTPLIYNKENLLNPYFVVM
jgi:3'(2'), 5'-bisphosphate nucleotidase